MKISQLKNHALLQVASKEARSYIAKCKPETPEQDPLATKREGYAIEILLSIGNVVSCIDQLHFAVDMLSGYRSNVTSDRMSRYDYIAFGIENYFMRLTSVFDRCLRLANVTYQLGLPDRQCNSDSIINNSHIKGTSVEKTLKELDKYTTHFRSHRNTVAHKATYSEKELESIGAYYYIVEEDDSLRRYQHFYKKRTDDFVADKKKVFKDNVEKLELLVEAYFDALNTVFTTKLKTYV